MLDSSLLLQTEGVPTSICCHWYTDYWLVPHTTPLQLTWTIPLTSAVTCFTRTCGCVDEEHHEMERAQYVQRIEAGVGVWQCCVWVEETADVIISCAVSTNANNRSVALIPSRNKQYAFRITRQTISPLLWPARRSPRRPWKTLNGRGKKAQSSAVDLVSSGSICHNYVVVKGKSRKGLINLI